MRFFTLYPIYWVAERHLDPLPFNHNLLPYDVAENVRIESVAARFRPGTFDLGIEDMAPTFERNWRTYSML
jgi:hypothetical protein